MDRKEFLTTMSGLALFSIVPSKVLEDEKHIAPNDRLTKSIIGVGGIGCSSLYFNSTEACRLTAIGDDAANRLINQPMRLPWKI